MDDQLKKVFKVTGTPTERTWPGLTRLPEYKVGVVSLCITSAVTQFTVYFLSIEEFPNFPQTPLESIVPSLSMSGVELLKVCAFMHAVLYGMYNINCV